MTAPWLGVRICDLTILPVGINSVVHKANGDVEYLGDNPHCLALVVALDDLLSQVGGIRGHHGRAGGGHARAQPLLVYMFKCLMTNYPDMKLVSYRCHINGEQPFNPVLCESLTCE